ncbi:ribulose phosphate epimerase [Erysipelothrix larvae]|uniref:Ribulose-phosphate 3-epimerase n=1 Tax=Erysipelothrix larvae TaxID=1514105 RepID=A0A120JTP0_9FIRM|nr:ribulose-phosphate 3-epimerase [Erysipelothrix larvae]AMC93435.1 ribulose phosphate epimerase [Erysipelothrix larvae]
MEKIVAPSILAIDFKQLPLQIKRAEISAEWFHYDVMDGVFVNNISFGPDILKQINALTDRFMDIHLMIENPVKYFDAFIDAGADSITFHVETMIDVETGIHAIEKLHEKGVKAGITLRPSTPLDAIYPYLKYVDLVLVMSVEPGFGGQAFIPSMLERIEKIDEMRSMNNYHYLISVDGGINQETGHKARNKGADVLVAGSYVFSGDIEKAVASLL